jgi:hypothetical protein
MAKVIGPLGSSEARGRVGGLIYNTWRGISTVKVKHAPCQPRTSLQLALRAIAITLVRLWASCVNKVDWNNYAAIHPYVDGMGNSIRATGANWYVALNTRLKRMGLAAVETPPAVAAPNAIVGLDASCTSGSFSPTWTAPSLAADGVDVWMDGPHSPGRKGSLAKANYLANWTGDQSGLGSVNALPGNYTLYARGISLVDGQVSVWVSKDIVVTA